MGGPLSTARARRPSVALVLAAQRDRWLLWLPVAAIAGAAYWLTAPAEPPLVVSCALAAGAMALSVLLAAWPSARIGGLWAALRAALAGVLAFVAFAGLGAVAAGVRAKLAAQPVLAAPLDGARLEGWIAAREGGARPRLRILVRALEGAPTPPRYVRVSAADIGALDAGRAVRCRASLRAPDGPLAPGAYDFARRAYFERLGATGFVWGRCRPALFGPPPDWRDRLALRIAAMRGDLAATIIAAAPGRGGAIAAALIAGDESVIDADTNKALRDSGLGHVLSVSGLHMGIVGGLVFGAIATFLALIPPIALRWPVKKLAAATALVALALYLVISGSSVPAIRSFVMACVAFGAILLDRPAISMRGLALATLIVVLLFPESVLEPGFQMSFAATAALVAAFEANQRPARDALPTPGPLIGALQWLARTGGVILLTSLVAGFATDPFALYHFQRFSAYGLVANLAMAPIISFVVAPAAAIAAVLAPFGLADAPLDIMGRALDLIARIGASFAERPEAVLAFPQPPPSFLCLSSLAIVWACAWRGALRWGGLAWAALAVGLYIAAPQPVLAFDSDLRAVFAREDGAWTLAAVRGRSTFARDRVGAMLGLTPARAQNLAPPQSCIGVDCTWRTPSGRAVMLVRDEAGFAGACVRHAIVLSPKPAPLEFRSRCAPRLLLDAPALAREGGAKLYEIDGRLFITRASPSTMRRRWSPP